VKKCINLPGLFIAGYFKKIQVCYAMLHKLKEGNEIFESKREFGKGIEEAGPIRADMIRA